MTYAVICEWTNDTNWPMDNGSIISSSVDATESCQRHPMAWSRTRICGAAAPTLLSETWTKAFPSGPTLATILLLLLLQRHTKTLTRSNSGCERRSKPPVISSKKSHMRLYLWVYTCMICFCFKHVYIYTHRSYRLQRERGGERERERESVYICIGPCRLRRLALIMFGLDKLQ